MAIKLDCPRCKQRLQVPSKLADGYVHCPQCKGRVWVAREAAAAAAPPPDDSPPAPVPSASLPIPVSPAVPAPVAPPPAPARRKKVARFITAEAAQSTLQPAADGKLPDLRLEEGAAQQKPQSQQRSMNPLVLLGVLSASVVVSVAMVLIGVQRHDTVTTQRQDHMRQMIESEFFGGGNIETKSLEPYQMRLREAQRAHSHGDFNTERERYRRVLDMLRAERGAEEKGLTGSRKRDKELEEAISVLLGGQ